MLGIFIEAPLLALVPAFCFLLLYWRRRTRAALVAALGWLLYAGYEEAVRQRLLCSGECNIRVDLLLLYPVLLLLSLGGWVHSRSRAR